MNTFKWVSAFSIVFILFLSNSLHSQDCNTDLCAKYKSEKVPRSMTAGSTQNVRISFKIARTNNWSSDNILLVYYDPRMNPKINNVWGIDNITLNNAVIKGKTITYKFVITAPMTPGVYNFQWQLQSNGVAFGEQTPFISIKVQ